MYKQNVQSLVNTGRVALPNNPLIFSFLCLAMTFLGYFSRFLRIFTTKITRTQLHILVEPGCTLVTAGCQGFRFEIQINETCRQSEYPGISVSQLAANGQSEDAG